MDAVEKIHKIADGEILLKHYNFKNINKNNHMIRAACAIHGGTNPTAFVFNNENKLWYCHTKCKKGGDIFDLIMLMENVSFKEAVQIASKIFLVDINGLQIKERTTKWLEDTNKWIKFMKKQKRPSIQQFDIEKFELYDVNSFRDFKKETLQHFNLKYAEKITLEFSKRKEPLTLYNRLVIPLYFNKICIGMSIRKTKAKDFPKWLHYPEKLETGNILYNYDETKERRPTEIIIVEGIFDVWKLYEANMPNTMATFGSHITKEQEKLLLQLAPNTILAFDGDDAGIKATLKSIEQLKHKTNLHIMEFTNEQDPGQCTIEELQKIYKNKLKHVFWRLKYENQRIE